MSQFDILLRAAMSHEEFVEWLNAEVRDGRMTRQQRQDLLSQKVRFDARRTFIEREFRNQIVGFVSNQLLASREIHELLNRARTDFPNRMIYFEPVGFDLL